jgi:hypothetical protein
VEPVANQFTDRYPTERMDPVEQWAVAAARCQTGIFPRSSRFVSAEALLISDLAKVRTRCLKRIIIIHPHKMITISVPLYFKKLQ